MISTFCALLSQDKPLMVHGSGEQGRDFLYISDVIEALLHAMHYVPEGLEIVNLCGGNMVLVRREFAIPDKETYLVIQEWKDIVRRDEFRIFWRDGQITGASQQYTGLLFNYNEEELDTLQAALNCLQFPSIPYKEYTADVYWDGETFQLIECNPFGAHSSSGAALFHWDKDYDVLYGTAPPEFRYLSIIKL